MYRHNPKYQQLRAHIVQSIAKHQNAKLNSGTATRIIL